jgi:hypothetical protein
MSNGFSGQKRKFDSFGESQNKKIKFD